MTTKSFTLSRAFRQAPWRLQTQVIAGAAVGVIVLAVIGALYLATAARAATAGRDVQRLEARKAELIRQNEELRAEIARLKSAARLQARAREMGLAPATQDSVEYLVVPGYGLAPPTAQPPMVQAPAYDETLGSWLTRTWSSLAGRGGG